MLLNGPSQYDDHLKGKKHAQKLRELRRPGLPRPSGPGSFKYKSDDRLVVKRTKVEEAYRPLTDSQWVVFQVPGGSL